MFSSVYFDHNATTALEPVVREAMLPWLAERHGNASSRHEYGRAARQAIDEARGRVAAAVGAQPAEIVFTSSGSEANNLFLKGAAARLAPGLVVVSAIEHSSVLKPAEQLARNAWRLQKLAVDGKGSVEYGQYADMLKQKPRLLSLMLANNETGVVQEVAALAGQSRDGGAWFHTDAVQAFGKMAVDFRALNECGVHALTLSAHKIGGPQGAAALVLDKHIDIEPLIAGGGQERDLRSGTENVAAIVGLGAACELVAQRLAAMPGLLVLRQRLERGLRELGATIFSSGAKRLPNTVCFAVPGLEGETLVGELDRAGFAVASGAACSSANPEPSSVLRAMGVPDELARGAVRLSLGPGNTAAESDDFLRVLRASVEQLQRLPAMAVQAETN